MTNQEIIDVVQAHLEGREIETSAKGCNRWHPTVVAPTWSFDVYDYRVKPEPPKPREFWICSHPTTLNGIAAPCLVCVNQVHVREVLP